MKTGVFGTVVIRIGSDEDDDFRDTGTQQARQTQASAANEKLQIWNIVSHLMWGIDDLLHQTRDDCGNSFG